MRRPLLSLSLSLCIHAVLLALLPASRLQPVSHEILKVTFAVQPGGGASGGVGKGDSASVAELSPGLLVPQEPQVQSEPQIKSQGPQVKSEPQIKPREPQVKPKPQVKPPETVAERTPPPNATSNKSESSTVLPSAENTTQPSTELTGARGSTSSSQSSSAGTRGGVGGGGTGGIVDASRLRVTKKVPAEYPTISRRRRDQGTVILILNIHSGRVAKAEIEKSSGHSALDESAKKAISAWEFDTSGFGESLFARISFVFSLTGP